MKPVMLLKYLKPADDITAQELAYLLTHIPMPPAGHIWGRCNFTMKQWLQLPSNLKRHFRDIPTPPEKVGDDDEKRA